MFVHMCFSSSKCLSGGQGTCVPGSVHVSTAELPAAVSCKAAGVILTCTGLWQHMKASMAHFSTL